MSRGPHEPFTVTGRPYAVHDGDTLKLSTTERGELTIRLEGIDAPELGQLFSKVSRNTLRELVSPGPVTATCAKSD